MLPWLVASLALTVAPQLALDPELARLRADFAKVPRATTEASLESIIADGRPHDAARLWLGSLRYEEHDYARAEAQLGAIRQPALLSLAKRGLGDVAFSRRRFGAAEALYTAALEGAAPALRVELESKRVASHREHRRSRVALGCAALYLLVLARLAWSLRRASRRWPRELTFLAPVYLLFVVAALQHDPTTFRAISLIALGSFATIGCLFATRPPRIADVLATVIANAALAYTAAWWIGLLSR